MRSAVSMLLCSRRRLSSAVQQTASATSSSLPVVHLFYNDIFKVSLPPNHRFPMEKYKLVRETLQREFGDHPLVHFEPSPEASVEELATTHCPNYIQRYMTGTLTDLEVRRTGFPWSIEQVRRSTSSVGGTVAATRAVLRQPDALIAGHIAGGTHHAFYDYGEGFCIFSDIAVAANIALREFPETVRRVAIVDLDVHQGNGNAVLFQHRPEVFTFSMHCKENYFSKKQASDVDVEVDKGVGDELYLAQLQTWLPHLVDGVQPDLIFFQAGVDISQYDKLGKLSLSREGISRRNRMVFDYALKRGVKCVVTMGGGYPKDLDASSQAFQQVIQCHADVYRDGIHALTSHFQGDGK